MSYFWKLRSGLSRGPLAAKTEGPSYGIKLEIRKAINSAYYNDAFKARRAHKLTKLNFHLE